MFPRQDRDTTGVYSRSGISGTGTTGSVVKMRLPGVHFQGYGAEQPLPHRIAAHRPREGGRIGGGERLVDEPGRLPVGLQRDARGVEQHALPHQVAAQQARTRFQVVERDSGRDSSLLAAHREEGVADGRAGSHPRHPEVGVLKAEHPADGTVRDHSRRSRHQLPSPMGRDREHSQRLHLGLDLSERRPR